MAQSNLTAGLPDPPAGYPQNFVSEIRLKDGTPAVLRPIRPDDAAALQQAFRRLSPDSIYLRFLETVKELSDERASELANVDYRERMALVAEIREAGEPRLNGVARYAMVGPQQPGIAECAIVVVDDYQSRGLATMMMKRLAEYARSQGIRAFIGTIHHTNARIMRFIQNSGLSTHRVMLEPGTWEITIYIDE